MKPDAGSVDKLDAILDKLDGVRRQGHKARAYCPAHEPEGRSARAKSEKDLSIWPGDLGVMLKCHAGCSFDAVRDALCARGLTHADFRYDGAPRRRKRGPIDRRGMELEMVFAVERLQAEPGILGRLRVERGWPSQALRNLGVGWDGERLNLLVRDEAGKPHDVLRYDPFATRGPKMLGGQGRTRLPWPSPEGIEARSRWLFVVEGEGTVISLAALGLPAVALPGSMSAPTANPHRPSTFTGTGWKTGWAKRFPRSLALLPDGNEVGRTLMRAAAYDLERAGCVATVCDLGYMNGEDVGDWIRPLRTREQRGFARDLLQAFVESCRRQPARVNEARELLHAFHGSLSEGGRGPINGVPTASNGGNGPAPERAFIRPSSENALWNWEAA